MVYSCSEGSARLQHEMERRTALPCAAQVYMVGRDMKKLEAAASTIRAEVGKSAMLEIFQCDLSNLE